MNAFHALFVFGSTLFLIASLFCIVEVNSKPEDLFQTDTTTTTTIQNSNSRVEGITIELVNIDADVEAGVDVDVDVDVDVVTNVYNNGINVPDYQSRIVGGSTSDIGEFPYYGEQ